MNKTSKSFYRISPEKSWIFGSLVLCIFFALLMRLPFFAQIPSGLNRDEAALGYNAYSIFKTGADEWGNKYPIRINSFGDQKLPGYVYFLIPFIAIFGLDEWVVRLPSFLAGLGIIACLGFLTSKIGRSLRLSSRAQRLTVFFSMFFTAISPWSMHFSRVAYESHLALLFFLIGSLSLLEAISNRKNKMQRVALINSAVFFALSMLTYHSYQLIVPLVVAMMGWVLKSKRTKIDSMGVGLALAIGVGVVAVLITGGVVAGNVTKSIGTSALHPQLLLQKATAYRSITNLPFVFNKLLFNKWTEGTIQLGQNIATIFSGRFFFVEGSGHGDHSPGNMNLIHVFQLPLVLVGILHSWKRLSNNSVKYLFIWMMTSLVPGSLTTRPLLEVRLASLFPLIDLLSALGLVFVIQQLKQNWQKIGFVIFTLVCSFYFALRFYYFYTRIAPSSSVNNSHYHQLAKTLFAYHAQELPVVTHSPTSSPYIWYLFENHQYIPVSSEMITRYPGTDEGFVHTKSVGNVHFEEIDWLDACHHDDSPAIFVVKTGEPGLNLFDCGWELVEVVQISTGSDSYQVWRR